MQDSVKPSEKLRGRPRRYFPILLWIICLGVILWCQVNPLLGMGVRFAVTSGTLFVACFGTLIWFSFLSPVRRTIRITTFVICMIVMSTLVATFRIEEVTGGLVPTFTYRWAPDADENLAPIEATAHSELGIDLTPTDADFPQFLGPTRNLVLSDRECWLQWDEQPPLEVWRRAIGAGWSGFAAVNGYAITLEQRGESEIASCYEIATGEPVWASEVITRHETVVGGVGPRSTPTIHEGRVYVQGGTGILRCLNGADGREEWKRDLLAEFGVTDDGSGVAWGRAGSPLMVDDKIVVPAGGPATGQKHSLVAYDRLTGEEIWRGGNRQVSYCSPALATINNQPQILIVTEDAVCGHAPHSGQLLWEFDWPGNSTQDANTSQPVALPDDHIFVSKGYGQGAALLRVNGGNDAAFEVAEVWYERRVMKTKFTNVVVHEDHVYGLNDTFLECIELQTGERKWKKRYDYGQILLVGSTLLVLDENGELFAVEANPNRHTAIASVQALEGLTWNNLCLYDRYLLIRNGEEAVCFDLRPSG